VWLWWMWWRQCTRLQEQQHPWGWDWGCACLETCLLLVGLRILVFGIFLRGICHPAVETGAACEWHVFNASGIWRGRPFLLPGQLPNHTPK
jgi:hypothetical protein